MLVAASLGSTISSEGIEKDVFSSERFRAKGCGLSASLNGRVVKLVDTRDLKSLGPKGPCRFESGRGHQ